MRRGRNIVISAILALSAGGSILVSAAVPAATAQASGAHVHVVAISKIPNTWYHA